MRFMSPLRPQKPPNAQHTAQGPTKALTPAFVSHACVAIAATESRKLLVSKLIATICSVHVQAVVLGTNDAREVLAVHSRKCSANHVFNMIRLGTVSAKVVLAHRISTFNSLR